MEIYFDKDFMQNFFLAKRNKENYWADFEKEFLNKIRNYTLITNFQSQEEMEQSEYGAIFLDLLADKVKRVIFINESEKDKWIMQSIADSGGYKFFLLELDDSKTSSYAQSLGYEFISTLNFEKVWSKYMDKEIRKSIDSLPNSKDPDIFDGWSDLKIVKQSPTNTIIIVDKYILSDKSNQKITDNLIPALESIIPNNYRGKLDIMIISEEIKSNEKNRSENEKAKEIVKKLSKHFSNDNQTDIWVKILIHNKSFYPIENMKFHDRFIYTNNYTIECGEGFNLFEGKKRICSASKVEIHFNYQPFFMGVLPRHMAALRKYIAKVKRTEVRPDQFKFYPDTECKLLT